jgi:hypothetical protein
LCPELKAILDAELAAGNRVVEDWEGYGSVVMLARPFILKHQADDALVEFREINDPHYWLAEWRCRRTGQLLACRF